MAQSGNAAAPGDRGAAPGERRGSTPRFAREELHALPLRLSARIALGRARLGELLRLRPGAIVPTATPVGEPSRLVVEGVPVGRGELLEIKGRIAFRVTGLGDDDD